MLISEVSHTRPPRLADLGGGCFAESTILQDEDLVVGLDGGEAVGDHEAGGIGAKVLESQVDESLGSVVERRGGFAGTEEGGDIEGLLMSSGFRLQPPSASGRR